jgi:hypothetical protein
VLGDGTTVQWASTDPINQLDVFFWDESNKFTAPLRSILDAQGPQNPKLFVYRRVNSAQANAKPARVTASTTKPIVDEFNKNSITASGKKAFVIPYIDLAPSAAAAPGQRALAETPGNIFRGTGIFIDSGFVAAYGSTIFPPGGPVPPQTVASTLLAQVVAHETGHDYGQRHPLRPSCCAAVAYSNPPVLTLGQFTIIDPAPLPFPQLEILLANYQNPSGSISLADNLQPGDGIQKQSSPAALGGSVYLIELNAIPVTVSVEIQQQEIMDWSPYLNILSSPALWNFDPVNLASICLRTGCRQ